MNMDAVFRKEHPMVEVFLANAVVQSDTFNWINQTLVLLVVQSIYLCYDLEQSRLNFGLHPPSTVGHR